MTDIIAKMRKGDGLLVQILADGSEVLLPMRPIRPMTEAEIEAAAASDPDNLPPTDDRMAHMVPVPRARTLRRALRLTQEEFAARFHIPLGTLRDWEQGRTEPDQPARAFLKVIASDPEAVARALASGPVMVRPADSP